MNDIIYYIFIYLIEAAIMFLYCQRFFEPKTTYVKRIIISLTCYMILLPLSLLNNAWINFFGFFVLTIIIMKSCFEVHFINSLFHSVILLVLMTLSEAIVVLGMPQLIIKNFRETDVAFENEMATIIITKFIYLLLSQIICHFFAKKKTRHVATIDTSVISVIPGISGIIAVFLGTISLNTNLPDVFTAMLSFSIILLLFINIFIFGIQQYNEQKNLEYSQMELQLQHEYDTTQYYKMLSAHDEKERILIHDIKNHFISIAALNDENKQAQISEYINNILASDALKKRIKYCDNEVVNVLVSQYYEKCNNKGIAFSIDIRQKTLDFITDEDATSLISNLLDNAFNAASNSVDTIDNTFVELTITHIENSPSVLINVKNTCSNNPFSPNGKLVTSNPDKKHHGFGIKSINNTIKKYNGEMKMYYEDNTNLFHTIITIQK